jgi:hypothetical protein
VAPGASETETPLVAARRKSKDTDTTKENRFAPFAVEEDDDDSEDEDDLSTFDLQGYSCHVMDETRNGARNDPRGNRAKIEEMQF